MPRPIEAIMTKTCNKCGRALKVSMFTRDVSKIDGLRTVCKDCDRERRQSESYKHRNRQWANLYYKQNKNKVLDKRRAKRDIALAWKVDYLLAHPCVDCGESDLLVLEFDHNDPEHKEDELCKMVARGAIVEELEAEASKCSVRCANCHRRKTAHERNFAILGFI